MRNSIAETKAYELGFNSYKDYLKNSFYWHSFRQKCIRDTCQACNEYGNKRWMHLHHLTYERLGAELPEDVVTLCEFCHEQAHKLVWNGEAELADAHLMLRKRHVEVGFQMAFNFDDACNQPDRAA